MNRLKVCKTLELHTGTGTKQPAWTNKLGTFISRITLLCDYFDEGGVCYCRHFTIKLLTTSISFRDTKHSTVALFRSWNPHGPIVNPAVQENILLGHTHTHTHTISWLKIMYKHLWLCPCICLSTSSKQQQLLPSCLFLPSYAFLLTWFTVDEQIKSTVITGSTFHCGNSDHPKNDVLQQTHFRRLL